MKEISLNELWIIVVVIPGVLAAGCSDQSAPVTPVTTVIQPKYVPGDIIARSASATDTMLYVITSYDSSSAQYTRRMLYKNTDGSWGHFISNASEVVPRSLVESVYPVKVAHVKLTEIALVTPTAFVTTSTTRSGNAPVISGISPAFAASTSTVSVTVTGDNFRDGATVKLIRAGYPAITATGLSVSETEIDCSITFSKAEKGVYNLVVTNPDGQSDTLERVFTVGDVAPVIGGVSPSQGALNETLSLTINGQNFKEGVRVSLMRSATEIICTSPVSTESTKITCTLDLGRSSGATAGDWNVTVLNIDGQQKGTWSQKFRITNST